MGMAKRKSKGTRIRISRKFTTVLIIVICVAAVVAYDFIQRSSGPDESQISSHRTMGDRSAPLRIIEFIDFQCPECAKTFHLLHKLIEEYSSQFYVEVKYFPLNQLHSLDSAVYAECCARQDKFWPFIELLFENQSQWKSSMDATAAYKNMADQVGVELDLLESCVNADEARSVVFADKTDGESRFVRSTPTFFINGKMFVGYKSIHKKLAERFDLEEGS